MSLKQKKWKKCKRIKQEKIIKKMNFHLAEQNEGRHLTVQHSQNNTWQDAEGFGFFMMKNNSVSQLKEKYGESDKHWLDNAEACNIYYIQFKS